MACEARIVRVLRTMGFPGLADESQSAAAAAAGTASLAASPDSLAKIVSWIEDTKVRGLAIPDRDPLRNPGPNWEAAFFDYLREMGCPGDFKPTRGGPGGGGGSDSSAVLRGLSWLVDEAVACDFEDNGKDYVAAAKELLSRDSPYPPQVQEETSRSGGGGSSISSSSEQQIQTPGQGSAISRGADAVAGADGGEGFPRKGKRVFPEVEGFAAGAETGSEACDSVATVLRMLFLSDFRELQDEVNGVIALAQSSRTEAAAAQAAQRKVR